MIEPNKKRSRYPSELEDRIFEDYLKKCREGSQP